MREVWESVQRRVEQEIGPEAFQIWFERLALGAFTQDRLEIRAPDRYVMDWVQGNYLEILSREFATALGRPLQISFSIGGPRPELGQASTDQPPADRPAAAPIADPVQAAGRATGLILDKTFDNFVIGPCNQFAHAASLAVSDFPGSSNYNPLFVYGGTGLGKTHLVQAIGNRILQQDPDAMVVYTTAESFVNDMINAIRFKRMEEFRDRYREQSTILLIDDVQFLAGRDRSQEEFFHTFQAFHTTGRQIVMTSDVLPREMRLEPRLRTRMEGGLLADMQPPDIETMVAILRKKADDLGIRVPDELALWISARIRGNIRELEGVLNRLAMLSDFYSAPLSVDFAREHLGAQFAETHEAVTPDKVMEVVARFFNVKVTDLKGKRRVKSIAWPRQVAMYLSRKHTELSYPDLGRAFGGRDHSTVIHSHKKVSAELERDPDLRHLLQTLEQNLGL